jgi:hypothetical protein
MTAGTGPGAVPVPAASPALTVTAPAACFARKVAAYPRVPDGRDARTGPGMLPCTGIAGPGWRGAISDVIASPARSTLTRDPAGWFRVLSGEPDPGEAGDGAAAAAAAGPALAIVNGAALKTAMTPAPYPAFDAELDIVAASEHTAPDVGLAS